MLRKLMFLFYGPLLFSLGLFAGWRSFAYIPPTNVGRILPNSANLVDRDQATIAAACSRDLVETWQLLKTKHVGDPITDDQLRHGAIAGMVNSMKDQFSHFMDPKEAKLMQADFSGKFTGIGAGLKTKDEHLYVQSVMPDSPALKAGIRRNDEIVAVDGQSIIGKSTSDVVSLIRGKSGTSVFLTILRSGNSKTMNISVIRAEIKTLSVKSEMIPAGEKKFMRISVSEFNMDTEPLFSHAVGQAIGEGADGVILDLRNDGGGLLGSAVKMVCRWKSGGTIVTVKAIGEPAQNLTCDGPALFSDMPTVVLVNGFSASASEVVTGALQDFGKARIIGEKTFGKGCGQNDKMYTDGSILRLVTFLWFTPNGRSIHKTGLMPDEVVVANPDDLDKGIDVQMERALQYLSTPHAYQ